MNSHFFFPTIRGWEIATQIVGVCLPIYEEACYKSTWHLWQSGILTLRNANVERVTNVFGEAGIVLGEGATILGT